MGDYNSRSDMQRDAKSPDIHLRRNPGDGTNWWDDVEDLEIKKIIERGRFSGNNIDWEIRASTTNKLKY